MGNVVGVVFHIMGASMAASDGWFHNPASKVSAHFGIGQDGKLVQWVDTTDKAWHAGNANSHWIGVETEGTGGALSEAGIQTFGRLYRWLHDQTGVPYGITDDPVNGHGLGWHGMGGGSWGGHPYCPGPERRAQRARVIQLAQGAGEEDDMGWMDDRQLIIDAIGDIRDKVNAVFGAAGREEDAAVNTDYGRRLKAIEDKVDQLILKLK